eukprot:TRINITY_DN7745_c0_g2_i1.p1 TRINITY_DN7745_c0_g2~~TRINITY_DN7745_c0_g2_i1.p1  ORF type:complete len:377 (+),score=142.92 TRINITY_DN7745_c0_g2_i1:58-1131(+)
MAGKALSSVRAGSSRLSTVLSTVGMRRSDAETIERSVASMLTDSVMLQRLESHADPVEETLRSTAGLAGSPPRRRLSEGAACAPAAAAAAANPSSVVMMEDDDDDSGSGSWINVTVQPPVCPTPPPLPCKALAASSSCFPAAAEGVCATGSPASSPARPSSPRQYVASFNAVWGDSRSNFSSTSQFPSSEHLQGLEGPAEAAAADPTFGVVLNGAESPTVHLEVFHKALPRGEPVDVEELFFDTPLPQDAIQHADGGMEVEEATAPAPSGNAALIDLLLASISDAYNRICDLFTQLFFPDAGGEDNAPDGKAVAAMRYVFLSALLTVGIIAARRVPYQTAVPFLTYLVRFVAGQFDA